MCCNYVRQEERACLCLCDLKIAHQQGLISHRGRADAGWSVICGERKPLAVKHRHYRNPTKAVSPADTTMTFSKRYNVSRLKLQTETEDKMICKAKKCISFCASVQ